MNKRLLKKTISYKIIKFIKTQMASKWEMCVDCFNNLKVVLKDIIALRVPPRHIIKQACTFGIDSLGLTLIIVGISGMIIALQVTDKMVEQGAVNYIGTLITLVIIREIAPIMGSFAIISMVGSSMAAEIATMKVTEQVDAIKVSGVNPITYLITPRVIAGFCIMPSVITIAALVGIAGGYLSVRGMIEMNFSAYLDSIWRGLFEKDIWVMVLKSAIFGGIISLISSTSGYRTEGGAIDVGIATTNAVVYSFITIVIADFIISYMFFY